MKFLIPLRRIAACCFLFIVALTLVCEIAEVNAFVSTEIGGSIAIVLATLGALVLIDVCRVDGSRDSFILAFFRSKSSKKPPIEIRESRLRKFPKDRFIN